MRIGPTFSRLTILPALAALLATGAMAQQDPFAETDPFAPLPGEIAPQFTQPPVADAPPPAAPAAVTVDPFADAPAPPVAPASTGDPFDAAPAAAPAAPVEAATEAPAVEPPNPFGDPFAMPSTPAGGITLNPFDLFGSVFGTVAGDSGFSAPGQLTGRGISQLYEFRYEERRRFNGERFVVRTRMTQEEAKAFDDRMITFYRELIDNGDLTAFQPGVNDAGEWAQWMLYAQQVDLWQRYSLATVLASTSLTKDDIAVRWPGDDAPQTADAGVGGDGRPRNIFNENRSLDDQLGDFNPFAGARGGQQQNSALEPKVMDEQLSRVYELARAAVRKSENDDLEFIKNLRLDLIERHARRQAYREWRETRIEIVKEFVDEWNRRYEGQVSTIAGVRFELYRPGTAPESTTRGANVVITDYDLTPYDILTEDGALRGPSTR
jgi:hypothetical protein